MKKIIIATIGILILVSEIFFFTNNKQPEQTQEQEVLSSTLKISKEYATLRYQTDNVLINAKNYADYDAWNKEMSDTIEKWKTLENSAQILENLAKELTEEKLSFKFLETAQAYTKEEVTSIIDKAPMGKKISTLAKHLGVDAKMAQLILNETQNMISREAYGEEGDVFQTCENQAKFAFECLLNRHKVKENDINLYFENIREIRKNPYSEKAQIVVANNMKFSDMIMEELGLMPDLDKIKEEDEELYEYLYYGPIIPAHYSLNKNKDDPDRNKAVDYIKKLGQWMKL